MPNFVRSNVMFNGNKKDVNVLREFVKSVTIENDGKTTVNEFDFNRIVPMPEELAIASGSSGSDGMKYIILQEKNPITWTDDEKAFMGDMERMRDKDPDRFNQYMELGKKYLSNLSKYGYSTWYNFCNNEWGTKWNSSEVDWYCDDAVSFETAWSFPYAVIRKLSELFPNVQIDFIYADEDCGSNTGKGTLKGGECIEFVNPENQSKEAYEIFLELHAEYEDELVYNPEIDNYEWVDNTIDDDDQ